LGGPKLEQNFPNIRFLKIDSDKTWTLLNPEYTIVFRRDEIQSFPASYALAPGR